MLTDEVSQIQEVSVWQVELSNTSAKFRQWVNILRLVEDIRVCVCVFGFGLCEAAGLNEVKSIAVLLLSTSCVMYHVFLFTGEVLPEDPEGADGSQAEQ